MSKLRIQTTLEESTVKSLKPIIDRFGMNRSKLIDILLRQMIKAVELSEANKGYFIFQSLLTDMYFFGVVEYNELVMLLGPTKAREIHFLTKSTRELEKWYKEVSS